MLLDVSMSTTTNAMTKRLYDEGGRLPGPWLVDADGRATDDPGVLFGEPKGALLPLGGQDLGHKGFALALLVEALTSGLAGHGRADAAEGVGRVGLPPAHRSRRVRGPRGLRARDDAARRDLPHDAGRGREQRRCVCPASALSLAATRSSRAASRCAPGSWSRSGRGRTVSASRCPCPSPEAKAP